MKSGSRSTQSDKNSTESSDLVLSQPNASEDYKAANKDRVSNLLGHPEMAFLRNIPESTPFRKNIAAFVEHITEADSDLYVMLSPNQKNDLDLIPREKILATKSIVELYLSLNEKEFESLHAVINELLKAYFATDISMRQEVLIKNKFARILELQAIIDFCQTENSDVMIHFYKTLMTRHLAIISAANEVDTQSTALLITQITKYKQSVEKLMTQSAQHVAPVLNQPESAKKKDQILGQLRSSVSEYVSAIENNSDLLSTENTLTDQTELPQEAKENDEGAFRPDGHPVNHSMTPIRTSSVATTKHLQAETDAPLNIQAAASATPPPSRKNVGNSHKEIEMLPSADELPPSAPPTPARGDIVLSNTPSFSFDGEEKAPDSNKQTSTSSPRASRDAEQPLIAAKPQTVSAPRSLGQRLRDCWISFINLLRCCLPCCGADNDEPTYSSAANNVDNDLPSHSKQAKGGSGNGSYDNFKKRRLLDPHHRNIRRDLSDEFDKAASCHSASQVSVASEQSHDRQGVSRILNQYRRK